MIDKEIANHLDGLEVGQHPDLHGIDPEVPESEQLALQSMLGQYVRMVMLAGVLSGHCGYRDGNLTTKVMTRFHVRKYTRSSRAVGTSYYKYTGHSLLIDRRRKTDILGPSHHPPAQIV